MKEKGRRRRRRRRKRERRCGAALGHRVFGSTDDVNLATHAQLHMEATRDHVCVRTYISRVTQRGVSRCGSSLDRRKVSCSFHANLALFNMPLPLRLVASQGRNLSVRSRKPFFFAAVSLSLHVHNKAHKCYLNEHGG